MAKNSHRDKNEPAAEPTVEERVAQLLGPPPRADKVIEPEPAPPAPTPPPAAKPTTEEEPKKERLLVIPPSSKIAKTAAPEVPAEPEPTAGETIVPTNPEPNDEESEEVSKDIKPVDKKATPPVAKKDGKIKRFFKAWWHNRIARRLTIFVILALLIGVAAYPKSRYLVLNNAGVRSSASLTVLADSTQLPLKNVEVDLSGQAVKTDDNGIAKIEHVKLGSNQLTIQKRAFAPVSKTIVVGWGSNPLGNFQIQPTGSQYAIFIKDWLTGKAISTASASGSDADANADDKGKILLTIDTTAAQQDKLNVTIHADNYRDEQISLNLDDKTDRTVKMVISRKDLFVTNRTGKYDVYSVNIDGKDEKLVLAGTGLERNDIVLVQHPTDNEAALVSTRVNARNSDGYLLSTLTLINLDDNTTQAIAQSEQVQIVGWIDTRLIYVQIAAGASAADSQRFRLMSYDYKTGDKKQLDSANSFNDVLLNNSQIYYAPSSAYQKDPNTGLIQSNADGSITKTLLKDEVWNIFRVSYDTLNLATAKDSYSYKMGGTADPTKLSQAPTDTKNRLYVTSPDGKHSLWVDQRDGKGLLISYDTDKQADTTLETQTGIIYPVKWLTNSVVVYRVKNDDGTADYVLDINGPTDPASYSNNIVAYKVTDLFNAPGIDRWYYY